MRRKGGGEGGVASLLAKAEALRGETEPLARDYVELAGAYARLDERLAKIIAISDKYQAEAIESAGRLRDALEQLERFRPAPPPEREGPVAKREKPSSPVRPADPLVERLRASLESGSGCGPEDLSLLLRRYEKANARLEKIVTISDGYQSQLREISLRIDFMARTDPLTSLPNRRDMMERLGRELSRFERYGTGFAVILFDIDDFKAVNDTYGHEAGDMVLRAVAAAFGRELRRSDSCSRWGGEEFLVLCPEINAEAAMIVGEKCRAAIAAAAVEAQKGSVSVTISGGVASMASGLDLDALIRRADDALYRSKASGKNILTLWS